MPESLRTIDDFTECANDGLTVGGQQNAFPITNSFLHEAGKETQIPPRAPPLAIPAVGMMTSDQNDVFITAGSCRTWQTAPYDSSDDMKRVLLHVDANIMHTISPVSPHSPSDSPVHQLRYQPSSSTSFGIGELTEMDTENIRTERRRAQNRCSQRKYRAKKEEQIREATTQVTALQDYVGILHKRINEMEETNAELSSRVIELERSIFA